LLVAQAGSLKRIDLMSSDTQFQIPETVLSRTVGTETVLLNLGTSTYLSLDPVGGRFWELISQGNSFGQATATMLEEYDVSAAELEKDLVDLCADLRKAGLLEDGATSA
jgi:Coenzyme PQQ synthesis protein D (PqqD)